ncbi:hypothetical protein BPOR_0274g00090 [Botrytis porri]|uniref:Uncharacterized protein n=1 Tax=Botrytis porri TaxID=87229 RepID=A0A4Z1KMS0_9HELO|nr:hypothetical protein BPOR_0274g00090 [Botrytis porri]
MKESHSIDSCAKLHYATTKWQTLYLLLAQNMLIAGEVIQVYGRSGILNGALTILAAAAHISKRLSFFLNLPTGFQTALVIFLIHIPSIHNPILTSLSSKEKFLHLDQCGFILSTPTIISFLLVLEWGGSSYPWSSATIIKSLLQFFYSYSLIPILGIQTRRKRNDTT